MNFSPIPITRGVYQAPWIGQSGELVLVAITADRKLACEPVTVPHGASRILASDALYAKLDALDSVGASRAQLLLVKT